MEVNIIKTQPEIKGYPEIEHGDILLCADGHDVNYIMIVDEGNLPASLNLNTYRIESTGDTFGELYHFIDNAYDIKRIVKRNKVSLNIEIEEE